MAQAKSSIRLTAFAEYRVAGFGPGRKVDVGVGGLDARIDPETNKIQILLGNAPFLSDSFHNRAPRPGFGQLMVYGFTDAVEQLHVARMRAREHGYEVATAEFEVVVGHIAPGIVDRKLLHEAGEKIGLLNFGRTSAALQSQILKRFEEYAQEEGVELDEELPRRAQVGSHPEYFDRFLFDDRDFRHLKVFVIPVADTPGVSTKVRQLAYVRPGITILDVTHGAPDYRCVLPAWMTDEAAAARLRKKVKAAV